MVLGPAQARPRAGPGGESVRAQFVRGEAHPRLSSLRGGPVAVGQHVRLGRRVARAAAALGDQQAGDLRMASGQDVVAGVTLPQLPRRLEPAARGDGEGCGEEQEGRALQPHPACAAPPEYG